MWQSPGRSAVQRPTSLVCVRRVAMSAVSSGRKSWQKEMKSAVTSCVGAPGGDPVRVATVS